MSDLGISAASAAELSMMRQWAADEGWDPGRSDMVAFGAADPAGFLVGRVDGSPIACCSGVRYGRDYGFLGFYIARPEVRGQGYGIALWQAVLAHLTERTIGLDGVVDQQDNYRKSGFKHAFNHIRYSGMPTVGTGSVPTGIEVVDGRAVPFGLLADYDRRFFPAEREAFLSVWVSLPGHRSVAAVKDGELVGFGVLRPTDSGTRVGPFYSSAEGVAEAVLAGLLQPGEEVAFDVPDVNAAAIKLAESLGLSPTFECARMYAGGPAPVVDQAGIFATTTLELG
ncbi:GNAT family N-acetyltransferase [Kribbella sp. NPDC051718]|uniref:GNAT family N-acetyltransferase n=1 Tax=Kribbella sp. NPDC051718 TaxID=3155168 RepID=UPI00342DF56B